MILKVEKREFTTLLLHKMALTVCLINSGSMTV